MKKQHDDYKLFPFLKIRRGLAIMYPSVKRKPMVHGLMEVDVTEVCRYLREHKVKTGESLSFTAFIITCLAHAVNENKYLHAYRKGRKRLVIFDDVDVATVLSVTCLVRSSPSSTSSELRIRRPYERYIRRSGRLRWSRRKRPGKAGRTSMGFCSCQ